MDHDNLTNRYDQFILAGASIGALIGAKHYNTKELPYNRSYKSWYKALLNHIDVAVDLHDIRDVYIVEHRNCGAYKKFLPNGQGDYSNNSVGNPTEFLDHRKFSKDLSKILSKKLNGVQHGKPGAIYQFHSFLMDLRGDVELLYSST